MDTLDRFNQAVAYIEDHLMGEVSLKEAAKVALCSEHHFQRMFSFLAGLPLTEYIRRRRLTLAAFELQTSQIRILDLALKYGYSSADAFARAFQGFHGLLPSEARKKGLSLKAWPRITFHLSIQGGVEMHYRVIEKEAFAVVGRYKRVPIVFEGVNPDIAAMWASLDGQSIQALKALSNTEPRGMIGASIHFSEGRMEEKGSLDHYIGVATTLDSGGDFHRLEVAAGTWAVFESVGPFPETLQNIWGRIYSEWFPTSGYELAPGPEILWNEGPDTTLANFRSEIWIPVLKKDEAQG